LEEKTDSQPQVRPDPVTGERPFLQQAFKGQLAIQQRVLPAYRAGFFDLLAGHCRGGLSIFAGRPLPEENVTPAESLDIAVLVPARNLNFLRTTSPFYQCWQLGLFDWLEHWQPDVLIVEANPRTPSSRWAARWMHQRGRPVLGWGLGAPKLTGWLKPWREHTWRSFWRTLDGMIAYSRKGADQYLQAGFPAERVFIAPNAVARRPSWSLPQLQPFYTGSPLVLFVGRLQRRKRIDNLLSACAALPVELQPRLVIVGDGPAREEFEALAQQVYPSAEFTGARHGQELEAFFLSADLFVLPGSGGLAVQQAMSYGLPVIVAEGDGTQDDLVRAGNGWLVTPGDKDELRGVLREALSNPERLRRMGSESYRLVSDEINLEVMAAAFSTAANKITGKGLRETQTGV
jgi:glycosyltransferase involved in cell wall biosynthesis